MTTTGTAHDATATFVPAGNRIARHELSCPCGWTATVRVCGNTLSAARSADSQVAQAVKAHNSTKTRTRLELAAAAGMFAKEYEPF